jgi:hypothetical protein
VTNNLLFANLFLLSSEELCNQLHVAKFGLFNRVKKGNASAILYSFM